MTGVHAFSIDRVESLGLEAVHGCSQRTFDRHTHEQFGIGVITGGAQRSSSGVGVVDAQAGDLISVHPGEVHDGRPLGAGPRTWRMLYLEPSTVATLALDRTEGASASYEFRWPVLRTPGQFERCLRLHEAVTCRRLAAGALEELLILLLAQVRNAAPERPPPRPAVPAAIAQVLALMEDAPAHAHTLQSLADVADLSRYQLLRAVRAATGLTPHTYLTQRRLDRARQMIRTGHPLIDTALACGFADQSHLHRLFVRRYGLTPGAYARAAGARPRE